MVGVTVAAPIGPMGILCIQRTLAFGAAAGLATGLGAATVHLGYSALAVIGFGAIIGPWVEAHALAFGIVSGFTLFWFAIRMRRPCILGCESGELGRMRLATAYASAIGLGATNPLTIVLFCAALHTLGSQSAGPLLLAGVFVGSVGWWIILSTTVAAVRLRFDAGILAQSGRLASMTLMALGALALVKASAHIIK